MATHTHTCATAWRVLDCDLMRHAIAHSVWWGNASRHRCNTLCTHARTHARTYIHTHTHERMWIWRHMKRGIPCARTGMASILLRILCHCVCVCVCVSHTCMTSADRLGSKVLDSATCHVCVLCLCACVCVCVCLCACACANVCACGVPCACVCALSHLHNVCHLPVFVSDA